MSPHESEWFKSSHSGQNGSCVEARFRADGDVDLRDSKDPEGPSYTFPAAAWTAFVAAVKSGRFPNCP